MDLQELIKLCLQASVIISVYALGLEATPKDLMYVLQRPPLLVRAVLAMFVIMPVVAIVLVKLLELPHGLEVTLVALAISPIPPLLPKRQSKGGGHSSYALGLMVCMALLSLVMIPLWMQILGAIFGQSFSAHLGAVALLVLKMIVGPILIGMAVRALMPEAAGRMLRPAILLAGWLLPLVGLIVVFAMHHALLAALSQGAWIPLLAFIFIGIVVGHVLGGPDVDSRLVLAVSTASRHPGIAFAIAAFNFPQDRGVPALIALYLLVSMIATVLYMKWLAKRTAGEPEATAG
jgi:BASS family bile acid:Na+ symporter